jgi:5-carboxymethyl-2-hydroxymuconate isomerase
MTKEFVNIRIFSFHSAAKARIFALFPFVVLRCFLSDNLATAMPHIILEHSPNIVEKVEYRELFHKLHEVMTSFGVFTLDDIKSRVRANAEYYIADGDERHAFVHLELGILSGRSLDLREELGEKMMSVLQTHFRDSLHERHCIISLEIRELDRETYRKIVSAHASSAGM